MLDFHDIDFVNPNDLPILVSSIDHDSLAIALKGESDHFRHLLLEAMPKSNADEVLSNMEFLGSVRASAVDEAQSEIAAILNRLFSDGRIHVHKPPQS